MNRFALFALAATAIVVALVVGIGVLLQTPPVGPSPAPEPTHGASPDSTINPAPSQHRAASWTSTGNLIQARGLHTATLLPDGRVLVAGGETAGATPKVLATVELFDPVTGAWSATASMSQARVGHTATLLPTGKVLVVGGAKRWTFFPRDMLASAELYDPATGTWTPTGSMSAARRDASALLLPDGTVLVVGGNDGSGSGRTPSSELYEPRTGTWTGAPNMIGRHVFLAITVLRDGRVLVVSDEEVTGGPGGATSAQLYDPLRRTWTATTSMLEDHCGPSGATVLADGKVLVACGHEFGFPEPRLASAELYDPTSGTWTATGEMHQKTDGYIPLTLLANGHVLAVVGGSWEEVFDPATGSWTATVSGNVFSAGILLNNGAVLFAGGEGGAGVLADAELYDPGSGD